jgi:hypothetical protein
MIQEDVPCGYDSEDILTRKSVLLLLLLLFLRGLNVRDVKDVRRGD